MFQGFRLRDWGSGRCRFWGLALEMRALGLRFKAIPTLRETPVFVVKPESQVLSTKNHSQSDHESENPKT